MGCGCGSGSTEINTNSCSNLSNCQQNVAGASSGCGCSPCRCGQSSQAAPTPYYNQAPGVEECHKQVVIQQSFVTALSTVSAFNMPACNSTTTITIPGLSKIQVGSYIWNVSYGYLLVVSFDYLNQQITVKNECQAGNAAPGTAIPACTMFNVVDTPCECSGGQYGVFLATDFVAPAVGNCIDINVTGIAGLTVGANVQVGSGIYLLSAIVSPTIITICNEGSGAVHGTTVEAKDSTGQYITPIVPLSTNACTNAVQASGAILTCHNGVQAPLDATMIGQVPVVIDADTNEVEFQTVQLPVTVCATMTSCLVLLAGVTQYTIVVDDSSVFAIGELLIIYVPGYEDIRWKIVDITDSNHIIINKTTPQLENDVIGCDTAQVCLAPCCEQITSGASICESDWSSAFKSSVQNSVIDYTGSLAPAASAVTNDAGLTVINDTCNVMRIFMTANYYITGNIAAEEGAWARFTFTPAFATVEEAIGGSGTPTPVALIALKEEKTFGIGDGAEPCDPYASQFSKSFSHTTVYTLPPGNQLKIAINATVLYDLYAHASTACCPCEGASAAAMTMTIDHMSVLLSEIGIAMQEDAHS